MSAVTFHIEANISRPIADPLRRVARRQWLVDSAAAGCQLLMVGLAVLLIAAVILGSLPNLWTGLRIVVAALTWLATIGLAIVLLRPVARRPSLARVAARAERHLPAIEERLSSAVELLAEEDPAVRGSPDLLAHLIRQAQADAASLDPREIVRGDRALRMALGTTPIVLVWVVMVLLPATSRTVLGGLHHLLLPWRQNLPTSLASVAVTPGDVTLADGDFLDITARPAHTPRENAANNRVMLIRRFANDQRISQEMAPAGHDDFVTHLDDLRQDFRYKVAAERGESAWFTVTLHPRPTITAIDVRYEFPSYTGLSPKTDRGSDGAIAALIGTRVTLTIHTASPVILDKSRVIFDEASGQQARDLVADGDKPAEYHATFTVARSGHYGIRLSNEFRLTNRDQSPRPIVAVPDAPPTIVIHSPGPLVTVRPDDTVPVTYLAGDDFGVARIEAVLRVDGHEPQIVPVKFTAADRRSVSGEFQLRVEDVLAAEHLADADHIDYQFKATDNRDPQPQSGLSKPQTLRIDRNESRSLAARLDERIGQNLEEAVRQAIGELDRAKPRVDQAKLLDPRAALDEWQRHELHQASQDLPRTAAELAKAADAAIASSFSDVARAAKGIADNQVQAAAEQATRADLAGDNAQRNDAVTQSVTAISHARDALQALLDRRGIEADLRTAEASRDLADAARHQRRAAELMKPRELAARDPSARDSQQQALQKQQQAAQKLREAMDQSEPLRNAQAQEAARRLQELIRHVEDASRRQSEGIIQTDKHQEIARIQNEANDLTIRQQALNQDIRRTTDQFRGAVKVAGAHPPAGERLDDIVKELSRGHFQQAQDQMRQAEDQLRGEAIELRTRAKRADTTLPQKEELTEAARTVIGQADTQEALAKALDEPRRRLAATRQNEQPIDQSAQEEKQIAQHAAQSGQEAQDLERQAQVDQDPDIAHRAAKAAADLTAAQQDASKAALAEQQAAEARQRLDNAASPEQARAEQDQTSASLSRASAQERRIQAALARAEEDLREPRPAVAQDQPHSAGLKDLLHQAAEGAQEAAQAQQEASQEIPAAAAQAARALDEAARAMANAVSESLNQDAAPNAQGQSGDAGETSDSRRGVAAGPRGLPPAILPAAVRDLGLSADQWTRLSPSEQRELLNSAQQSGPPAYRQMIKDYYLRISAMHDGPSTPTSPR